MSNCALVLVVAMSVLVACENGAGGGSGKVGRHHESLVIRDASGACADIVMYSWTQLRGFELVFGVWRSGKVVVSRPSRAGLGDEFVLFDAGDIAWQTVEVASREVELVGNLDRAGDVGESVIVRRVDGGFECAHTSATHDDVLRTCLDSERSRFWLAWKRLESAVRRIEVPPDARVYPTLPFDWAKVDTAWSRPR